MFEAKKYLKEACEKKFGKRLTKKWLDELEAYDMDEFNYIETFTKEDIDQLISLSSVGISIVNDTKLARKLYPDAEVREDGMLVIIEKEK